MINYELCREEIKNESFVRTTEQVSQICQQMTAGTIFLPNYLLFVLSGIRGFLFFTTIVTIVVSLRRRKEQ